MSKELLLVNFKLIFALLSSNFGSLCEVHGESTTARALVAGLAVCGASHVLLHLVSINTLSLGLVAFTIITVEASLYPAFLLGLRSSTESASKDVLTFDRGNVALIAWHAVLLLGVLLGTSEGRSLERSVIFILLNLG